MADTTNKPGTGPASKDAVAGGKKLPLEGGPGIRASMPTMGTDSNGAHSAIMSLRYGNGESFKGGVEGVMTKKPT